MQPEGKKGQRMIYDLQKASMWKRISAWLFDSILLGIVAVLFAWLMSMALGFDGYMATLEEKYARYAEEYSVDFNMTLTEYETMTQAETEALNTAYAALSADETAVYAYNMVVQQTLLITTIGILLAFLLMEFFIPLKLKNGQTLGKKVFGVALMRTEGIRVNGVCLFIRTILGKYTIETMVPVLLVLMIFLGSLGIVGTVIIGLILLLQLGLLVFSSNRSLIHDYLATTVAVDLGSQLIFDTKEDLIAYKQKVHAQKAAKQAY